MTMYKALHPIGDIDRLYVSKKKKGEDSLGLKIASIHRLDSKTTQKELRKTDCSDQKQHKDQYSKNNNKTKMGRKAIVWIFKETNK